MIKNNSALKVVKSGFTLIELLIVIAILGTLAVVVLLALNPVQQLARARDSGRISGITQLGHAVEAYATSRNGLYIPEAGCASGGTTNWINCLVTTGEIATVPAAIVYSAGGITAGCNGVGGNNAVNNTWCYDATTAATGAGPVVLYARLESLSNRSRCAAGQEAWSVYSTAAGRGGGVCTNAGVIPTPGITTFAF